MVLIVAVGSTGVDKCAMHYRAGMKDIYRLLIETRDLINKLTYKMALYNDRLCSQCALSELTDSDSNDLRKRSTKVTLTISCVVFLC